MPDDAVVQNTVKEEIDQEANILNSDGEMFDHQMQAKEKNKQSLPLQWESDPDQTTLGAERDAETQSQILTADQVDNSVHTPTNTDTQAPVSENTQDVRTREL